MDSSSSASKIKINNSKLSRSIIEKFNEEELKKSFRLDLFLM